MSCSSFPRCSPTSWHPVPRYCSSWNPLDHSSYLRFHSSLLFWPPGTALATSRVGGNGVDSRLFRCGSTKSTLLPCARFVTRLSCVIEFLKMASSLDCMAYELSAWSLLIVSILVSRLPSLLFTVSYRCLISCMSFLMFFSPSLSVASIFSDIC